MEDLKSCPFCGSKDIWVKQAGTSGFWYVYCPNACCEFMAPSKQEVVDRWNRRAGEAFNGGVMLMGDRVYIAGQGYFTREARHV